jgi:hypothetical protein
MVIICITISYTRAVNQGECNHSVVGITTNKARHCLLFLHSGLIVYPPSVWRVRNHFVLTTDSGCTSFTRMTNKKHRSSSFAVVILACPESAVAFNYTIPDVRPESIRDRDYRNHSNYWHICFHISEYSKKIFSSKR